MIPLLRPWLLSFFVISANAFFAVAFCSNSWDVLKFDDIPGLFALHVGYSSLMISNDTGGRGAI